MFYSHESIQAYGVSTVWLVSTIGLRSSTKKISRKAIQEVNVQKACETILQPGAPMALRLQGTLLYGLSRVYSQQCHYVLTDAERVQAHMRAVYNAPKDLILEDDPEFDLNPDLPVFHIDDDGNLAVPQVFSQTSRKTSSQLSPLQPDLSVSSSNRSILAAFDLSQSPFGSRRSAIPEAFGIGTMTPSKNDLNFLHTGDEERELQALDDWGIEIDADGNIITGAQEPRLPQLPQAKDPSFVNPADGEPALQFDADGDVFMSGALPVFHSDPPAPFGQQQEIRNPPEHEEEQPHENPEDKEVMREPKDSAGQAPVRAQRKRRRATVVPDNQTRVSRQELKSWVTNYLVNAGRATRPRHGTTLAEARKNAFNLVFGCGVAGVGLPTGLPGFPHPLASEFAGEGLQARLLGIVITPRDQPSRGRRRTALEAIELEQDGAERRVRRRIGEENEDHQDAQPKLPLHDDGDDADLPPVEVGRRAGSALPDIPSDAPWNRPSSQIPSSSIKAGGSKPPSRHVSASPLHGRGHLALPGPEIERFSDNQPVLGSDSVFGSEGFALLPYSQGGGGGSCISGSGGIKDSPPLPGVDTQSTSQLMQAALDREGRNFLSYVLSVAEEKGYHRHPGPARRANPPDNETTAARWVDFDMLFGAEDQSRAIVAQAFYHVLSLATKNVIRVAQDGQGTAQPHGTIRIGVSGTLVV
ncbi:hypothetical protein VTJ83DRAFT_3876 [Remersonia thermophila]|uniref:Rad21/Rec8-like protein N-terminal domain-containing protein n=1 Tax=Remersonia thermophila TaxID=72144 RepID=A0ABR4DFA8_9PEZI